MRQRQSIMPNYVSTAGSADQMNRVAAWLVKKGYKLVPGTGAEGLGVRQFRRWTEKKDVAPESSARVFLVWCED